MLHTTNENERGNGVILSPDDKRLYVTNGATVVVFDVQGPGKLANKREFAKMEMGGWIEFRPKDDGAVPRACKILFISPKKTRYLFSDRSGGNVVELSRAEVVRRLRTGEMVRLDEEPPEHLFDRFMTGVVGKMKSGKAATA